MLTRSTPTALRLWVALGLLSASLSSSLWGEPPKPRAWISAPVIGLVAGQGRAELRAILGVPGASTLSDPIPLPEGVARIYLAPGQRYALIEQSPAGDLGLIRFEGTQPVDVQPIPGAIGAPDLVSFSPTGSSTALLDRTAGVLQVLTGLDSAPRVVARISVSDLDPGSIAAIGVSDDGMLPVALAGDGNVYLLSSSGSNQRIFNTAPSAGIGFLPHQAAVAIADVNAGTVSVVDDLAGSPTPRLVASAMAISGDRGWVRASGDGRFLVVAAAGARSAFRVDLSFGEISWLDLPAPASTLERLRESDVFLLSALAGEAAWLLAGGEAGPKVVFAPLQEGTAP